MSFPVNYTPFEQLDPARLTKIFCSINPKLKQIYRNRNLVKLKPDAPCLASSNKKSMWQTKLPQKVYSDRLFARPGRIAQNQTCMLHSGTAKTRQLVLVHFDLPLEVPLCTLRLRPRMSDFVPCDLAVWRAYWLHWNLSRTLINHHHRYHHHYHHRRRHHHHQHHRHHHHQPPQKMIFMYSNTIKIIWRKKLHYVSRFNQWS